MTEDEFFGRPTQAAHDEAFRKGIGDAALSLDVPADSAWQPPEGVTSASNDAAPVAYPDTLDPEAWIDAWVNCPIDDGRLVNWFRAAIQAGYNAARPLDPDTVYVDGREIPEADLRDALARVRRAGFTVVEPSDGEEDTLMDRMAREMSEAPPIPERTTAEPVDGSIHDRLMTMDVPRCADELHTAIVDARSHPLIPIIEEYMRELAQVAFEGGEMQAGFDREFQRLNAIGSPQDVEQMKGFLSAIRENAGAIRAMLGGVTHIMPEIADRDCSFIERDGDGK